MERPPWLYLRLAVTVTTCMTFSSCSLMLNFVLVPMGSNTVLHPTYDTFSLFFVFFTVMEKLPFRSVCV